MYHSLSSAGGWHGGTIQQILTTIIMIICGARSRLGTIPVISALCIQKTSTVASPFLLMFGRQPKINNFTVIQAYHIPAYQQQLQAKLAELQGFVETNLVEASHAQKSCYDH